MLSLYRSLREPITSRFKAQRAAESSAYVWVVIAMLLGFAVLANLGRPSHGGAPPWSPYLVLALCMIAMATLVQRRKSVPLAIATLIGASVVSVLGVLAFLGGKGAAISIPLFLLPLALRGLEGAHALRELPPNPAA